MKKINLIILFTILFTSLVTQAQSEVEDDEYRFKDDSGDLFNEISGFMSNIPRRNTDEYSDPTTTQLNTWSAALNNLMNRRYVKAAGELHKLDYDLIRYRDTSASTYQVYYILKPDSLSINHWGLYVYNPRYCRPLVIQAPHPVNDSNTDEQSAFVFRETQSLMLTIAGTHRCNESNESSCDGSTTVCSDRNNPTSESFKISDLAHNSASIFQETTKVLLNSYNDSHFIQLHGFSKGSSDPYVILSNGTEDPPTQTDYDYLKEFEKNLTNEDSRLTFKVAHRDEWTRLTGFSNTQGRLINGSLDPCDTEASDANGRFLHIEQERSRLRANETGWRKVSNALINTFGCSSGSTSQKSLISPLKIHPNPTSDYLFLQTENTPIDDIEIYNMLGQNVSKNTAKVKLNEVEIRIDLSELPTGIYFIKNSNSLTYKVYKE